MSQESHVEWTWQEAREHFSQVDPVFYRLCAVLDDPSESRPRTAFESLSHAIVGQQLSTKAAATIWGRFSALHGDVLSPTSVLEVSPERHRAVGISGQKHGYMQDLARHYLEDPASFDDVAGASNEDIIASWTRVKGLGRWTVQMHLILCICTEIKCICATCGAYRGADRGANALGFAPPHPSLSVNC